MFRASRQLFRLGGATPALARPSVALAASRTTPAIWRHHQRTTYSTKDTKDGGSSSKPPYSAIDPKHDAEIAQRHIKSPPPHQVSSTSTLSTGFQQTHTVSGQQQVGADVVAELHAIKDAFAMVSVPKEANYIGLAGTLPYLGTSLSTMYLSWSLNRQWPEATGFLDSMAMNHDSAQQYLGILEPIQLSYGAVIISFLGAIHWGMEWNERQPPNAERTRMRYGIGMMAPAVAWPTLLMPFEFALTGQFAAFAGLYFVDASMAERGWAPRWYAPYRFVLTGIVGAAIGVTLIGRAKIGDNERKRTNRAHFMDKGLAAGGEEHDWEKEEEEVKAKIKKQQEEKDSKKAAGETQEKTKEKSKEWAADKEGQRGDEDVEGSGGVKGEHAKAKVMETGGDSEEGTEGPTEDQKAKKVDRKADKSEGKKGEDGDGDGAAKEAPEGAKGDDKGHAEGAKKTKPTKTKAKGKTSGGE